MNTKNTETGSHGITTCALAIVRNQIEYAPTSRIVEAAAFVATDDTVSTRFEIRLAFLPPELSRRQSLEHVAILLPPGSTVVVPIPRAPRGLVRHLAAGRPMPAQTDAQALAELCPDLDLRPVRVSEQNLKTVATFFRLTRADRDAIISEKARRCADEAQALYLSHLMSMACAEERNRLAAAYQAWQALRNARPLGPFGKTEVF